MNIYLAHTQGFCAGVSSAIDVVKLALEKYGPPIYVRHHIVHNTTVIADFERQGVVFVEDLSEVPEGQRIIFSAHGIAPDVYEKAKERNLISIDATCPLVTKVHREAITFSKQGVQTILIGHRGHQELIGTSGYVNPALLHVIETEDEIDGLSMDPNQPIGYLTQTTLSVTETTKMITKLKAKFPDIKAPPKEDICFATQNRQDAVKTLAKHCDIIIICGSPHSSNSNRLKETAEEEGVHSYIIDTAAELDMAWFAGKQNVGISSGASVPRSIVDEVVNQLKAHFPVQDIFQEESLEKGIAFKVPKV
ncbi:MAG: 4-hydroxy-3-methylbut-2-enyl diphosphate reductase [Candidatus Margulisiibacteriota bacterium]